MQARLTVRWSVAIDAVLLSLVPLAVNVLRVVDAYGSKLPAVMLLLLIVFKNLVVLPGTSLRYEQTFYRSPFESKFDKRVMISLVAFLVLMTVAVARALGTAYTLSNVAANIMLILIGLVAIVTAFLNCCNRKETDLIIKSAPAGLVLLVVANLVVFAIGLRGIPLAEEDRLNQTLSLVGLSVGRVLFPLTFGTNSFGSIAALATLSAAVFWAGGGLLRKFTTSLLILCCVVALIGVDSRAAMLGLGLTLVWVYLLRFFPRLSGAPLLLVAASPILPFLMSAAFSAINKAGLLGGFVRSGAQGARLGVGTGRQYIWSSAGAEIQDAKFMHLIGYGSYGQTDSRFSSAYSWIFNQLGQTGSSVHNTALQNFFDMGYTGVATWIFCLWVVVSLSRKLALASGYRGLSAIMFATLFFMLLQAQTEIAVTIYTPELLFFFMTVAIGVAAIAKVGKQAVRQTARASTFAYGPAADLSRQVSQ